MECTGNANECTCKECKDFNAWMEEQERLVHMCQMCDEPVMSAFDKEFGTVHFCKCTEEKNG